MRKLSLAAALAAALFAVPAVAQDQSGAPTPGTPAPGEPTAPDGSKAFGFEPYFGVLGAYESFDNQRNSAGIPVALNSDGSRRRGRLDGELVQGVVGANIPLGPIFIGGEGMAAKGVNGNIDWEYGASGRAGFRAGDSGLFYGKAGYKWVNFDHFIGGSKVGTNHDYHGWEYGIGFEAGPKDIGLGGLTGRAGVRIRGEVSTFQNFKSVRPMLGLITHF